MNLRRCGVENLVHGPAKVDNSGHAARQLAAPIKELGLCVQDFAAKVYPSSEDQHAAEEFLRDLARPVVALHVGSGSERKNWPLENWIDLGNHLLGSDDFHGSLAIVSGEADQDRARQLQTVWKSNRLQVAKSLPLPQLAALFERAIFVGHDSGISHLAAAAGAKCILLFGPTDPAVWAPMNENVSVLRARNGNMRGIQCEAVRKAMSLW